VEDRNGGRLRIALSGMSNIMTKAKSTLAAEEVIIPFLNKRLL
jgi:hypothetical protein